VTKLAIGIAVVSTAAVIAFAGVASAKEGDVIKKGACGAASTWKLKLSPEDGRIEVEFELDQNVNGVRWRIRMRHNGTLFFNQIRRTRAPSGSFEARAVQPNRAGPDEFRARALNLRTGETCRARAVADF
jgi:hypothetical protein